MPAPFLTGLKVLDIAGEPLAMTGRLMAELGADVIKLEPPGGDPLRQAEPLDPATGTSLRFIAWNAGKRSIEFAPDCRQIEALVAGADVVVETPGFASALALPPNSAPDAVWLKATPFGLSGPRSHWQASDLGLLAASGNLYATGFTDRPPVRCSEPAGYAHCAAEAVFAILTALAAGGPQIVDLSMQECIMIASMAGAGQYPKTGHSGRRMGAAMGRTREIWPCADGYVSFGLRGGPSRLQNFATLIEQMEKNGVDTQLWRQIDWLNFNAQELTDEEITAIETPLADYFARHSMAELYDLAVATNLMLAPANSAREILASAQLQARELFGQVDGIGGFPTRAFIARSLTEGELNPATKTTTPPLSTTPTPNWLNGTPTASTTAQRTPTSINQHRSPWAGLKILEFGSGAAGPIAGRYFAEHGATVIKVESKSRPDFLRAMASGSEHGLEGSTLFEALNPGKQSIALNLKSEGGQEIARQLMHWADAVIENFAPKVLKSCGLDYDSIAVDKPDLVMLSTCLNGQTGPHRDYPGFGGQGAALAGYNYLTGWPDREPIGPYGTITDSLSPRFTAGALAAALAYRKRTGKGAYLDFGQVETAIYTLSPWLMHHAVSGESHSRVGNASDRACPHGVFPCAGEDRWIAIACWTEQAWRALAAQAGLSADMSLIDRLAAHKEIEKALATWTMQQEAPPLAQQLQDLGIEAVSVQDFADLYEKDEQLASRDHFVTLQRPRTGTFAYERNGFRLATGGSAIKQPAPLLGEHTEQILREQLKLNSTSISALRANGSIE